MKNRIEGIWQASMRVVFGLAAGAILYGGSLRADDKVVANAVNGLGVDLLRELGKDDRNLVFSPYSIQLALGMTYEGAGGETRHEMAQALHYPEEDLRVATAFKEFQAHLNDVRANAAAINPEALQLEVADTVFIRTGLPVHRDYLDRIRDNYGAALQQADFQNAPSEASRAINEWVNKNTHGRYTEIISEGDINRDIGLFLVNAVYLKAGWRSPFRADATKDRPFSLGNGDKITVPTMSQTESFGFRILGDFYAIALPYEADLQLVILLPKKHRNLEDAQQAVTASVLARCAQMPTQLIELYLPRFQVEGRATQLGEALAQFGMKRAFDRETADFEGIATPSSEVGRLFISQVGHRAKVSVDEAGTEVVAVTDVTVLAPFGVIKDPPKPLVIKVDHPFLFAIQDDQSGACLFIGQVADPR